MNSSVWFYLGNTVASLEMTATMREEESDDIEESEDNCKSNREMESHGESIIKWKPKKNCLDIVPLSGGKLERREKMRESLPD